MIECTFVVHSTDVQLPKYHNFRVCTCVRFCGTFHIRTVHFSLSREYSFYENNFAPDLSQYLHVLSIRVLVCSINFCMIT